MRPGTKIQSQIQKNTFGNSHLVPGVNYGHPENRNKMAKYPGTLALNSFNKQSSLNPAITGVSTPQLLARQEPIDMSLPDEENSSPSRSFIYQAKWRKARSFATRSSAVVLILTITLGGLVLSQNYLKLHKVFRGGAGTAAALKPNLPVNLLKSEKNGRINILLLGRNGDLNHHNPDITDTMMVASIDPINHTATLLSVPGDLWVNVPGAGVMKLNAAWQSGEFKYLGKNQTGSTDPKAIAAGFNSVDQSVSQLLGLNIDYSSLINLQGLAQAIDTEGGVTVNVHSDLVDPTMAWQNGGNPDLIKAGTQTLSGKQALLYITSKETTSDFARSGRQRDVLMALFNKIVSDSNLSDPAKLNALINTLGNNVVTDLALSDAGRLYNVLNSISSSNITSIDLSSASNQYVVNGNMNGQAIALPKAGLFNYGDIQNFVSLQLKNPYIINENAKIMILNGTTVAGLATNTGNDLSKYGYNIIGEANTPSSGWAKTTLVQLNKGDKYTNQLLENHFHVSSINKLPNKSMPTDGADFVIIIGNDEANINKT